MHIGVDATCWQNRRGYGRHARALLTALVTSDTSNHYTFCLDSAEQLDSVPWQAGVKLVRSRVPTALAAAHDGRRSVRDAWRMSRALSSPDFGIVFFPTVYSYVPVSGPAKKVVMIHDVIAETFPQWTQPSRAGQFLWNLKTGLGRHQADALVTVSDYSRQGILERFRLPPARVQVVGEAPDPIFRVLERPELPKVLRDAGVDDKTRLIVYVGGFAPHKNLGMLLNVFAELTTLPDFDDLKLVLVGEYANEVFYSEYGALLDRIKSLGTGERVVFTGYLPDPDLVSLLNLATVFVLPSLMEGFGLPAVEAAACGCPVIVTTASPLPALFGDAALAMDPQQADTLQAALAQILTDENLRQRLSVQGRATAERLSWAKAAQELRGIFGGLG